MLRRQYKTWLRYYKEAHSHKSPVKHDPLKKKRLPLDEAVLFDYLKKVTAVLNKSDAYLESTGIKIKAPLWRFDNADPTTWPSHKDFAYGHLLNV